MLKLNSTAATDPLGPSRWSQQQGSVLCICAWQQAPHPPCVLPPLPPLSLLVVALLPLLLLLLLLLQVVVVLLLQVVVQGQVEQTPHHAVLQPPSMPMKCVVVGLVWREWGRGRGALEAALDRCRHPVLLRFQLLRERLQMLLALLQLAEVAAVVVAAQGLRVRELCWSAAHMLPRSA